MKLKTSCEGYLMIDHRASPGIAAAELRKAGFVNAPDLSEGSFVEMATLCCSHCGGHQIKNPLRTRERGYCRSCDAFICDGCATRLAVDKECRPAIARADAVCGSDKPVPSWAATPLTLQRS